MAWDKVRIFSRTLRVLCALKLAVSRKKTVIKQASIHNAKGNF